MFVFVFVYVCVCVKPIFYLSVLLHTAQFIVHIKGPGIVALQNKKEPKQWLRIMNDELNAKVS